MKNISVAFCFDKYYMPHASVAISSLLRCGGDYDIYCVVPKNVSGGNRNEMTRMVTEISPKSTLTFLDINDDFNDSVPTEHGLGTYYRFMLAKMLPKLDKIIYLDADIILNDNLVGLWNIDLGDNIIAAVRDVDQGRKYPSTPNGYINAGILVMNLREIRRLKMYETWIELSKSNEFEYWDQDILNKTCDGKILYLPLKYNFMPARGYARYRAPIANGVFTQAEYDAAADCPVIIHYIIHRPWDGRKIPYGDIWWRHARMTPFYGAFLSNISKPKDMVRDILLFNCIKIMTVKDRANGLKYYLFGFIPLIRINFKKK